MYSPIDCVRSLYYLGQIGERSGHRAKARQYDCRSWAHQIHRSHGQQITTSWDFGWNEFLSSDRGLVELIDAIDFVFVDEHEPRLDTGTSSFEESVPEWRKRSEITILKLGDQGVVWIAPDRDIDVAAPKVKAIDTTGAESARQAGGV